MSSNKIDYDSENITFSDFKIGKDHALALTTEGALYGWGNNVDKQLGLADTKNYFSPTKIEYFENYTVHEISCGGFHSVVKASPKDEKDKIMFFNLGNNNGCENEGKTEEGILHLNDFDNADIKYWSSGYKNTFFFYNGEENASANTGVHHGYT